MTAMVVVVVVVLVGVVVDVFDTSTVLARN